MIYLYILQKMCFLQIFGTKTKAKNKATFGNIEYNSRDICTDSKCFFALKYFLLIQSNLPLAHYLLLAASQLSKKHISGRLLKCQTFFL